MSARSIVLVAAQGAGDAVCLTGAVRDMHLAYPGEFRVWWRGAYAELTKHNPDYDPGEPPPGTERFVVAVTPLQYGEGETHFATMFHVKLATELGVQSIPVTRLGGHVLLSDAEKAMPPIVDRPYWLIFAGGKTDMTTKWWPTENYQAVVNALKHEVQFVQVGNSGDVHPPLDDVVNLVGKTSIRELVRLMYGAQGSIGPISFGLHLAAAVESPGVNRKAVIIAGGREPAGFVAYPGHRFISTIGELPCCARAACWKFRVGDDCEHSTGRYASCMVSVRPERVIDAIREMI